MKLYIGIRFVIVVISGAAATTLYAESADRNKPTQIEADRAAYDDLKQTSVWEGNVILTRGTLMIRAQRLEIRQDPEGYQFGIATGGANNLAYFRQKRDGGDQYVEGFGERIDYDGKNDRVTLTTRATMKRLQGPTVVDEVNGAVIVMDNRTDTYTVSNAATATPGAGRVRATIAPRGQAAPAPGAALPLRSSPQVATPPAPSPETPK